MPIELGSGLCSKAKQAVAFPTPLAQFAIRQVRAGRRVGCRQNSEDILSGYARRTRGLTVDRSISGIRRPER